MSGQGHTDGRVVLEPEDTEGLVRQVGVQPAASAPVSMRRVCTSQRLILLGMASVLAAAVVITRHAARTAAGPAMASSIDMVSRVEHGEESHAAAAPGAAGKPRAMMSILNATDMSTLTKMADAAAKHVRKKRAGGDSSLAQKRCEAPPPSIIKTEPVQPEKAFCCFSGGGAKGTPDFCKNCFSGARAAPGSFCDQSMANCMAGGGDATWCGTTQPPKPAAPPEERLAVLPPTEACSTVEENCKDTKCCKVSGKTCYTKNKFFAGCLDTGKCVKGSTPGWDCDPVTSDTSTRREPRGYISLYCWSVMATSGYEPSLVRTQLVKGAGIFGCDEWAVLSAKPMWLKKGSDAANSTALPDGSAGAGSKLGGGSDATTSWVNANTFLAAWDTVGKLENYAKHDWVVKVDPDAVFLPSRLRDQLKEFGSVGKLFFSNCKGVRHGLYGSIEVLSKGAVATYIEGMQRCSTKLPYKKWGEDRFTEGCMEMLEIGHVDNFCLASDGCCGKILDHGVCKHASPCVTGEVAFHPFKNVVLWFKCLEEAQGHGA